MLSVHELPQFLAPVGKATRDTWEQRLVAAWSEHSPRKASAVATGPNPWVDGFEWNKYLVFLSANSQQRIPSSTERDLHPQCNLLRGVDTPRRVATLGLYVPGKPSSPK